MRSKATKRTRVSGRKKCKSPGRDALVEALSTREATDVEIQQILNVNPPLGRPFTLKAVRSRRNEAHRLGLVRKVGLQPNSRQCVWTAKPLEGLVLTNKVMSQEEAIEYIRTMSTVKALLGRNRADLYQVLCGINNLVNQAFPRR